MKMTRLGISELELSRCANATFLAVPKILEGYFYKIESPR
jgi:hypothetical protein